MQLLTKMKVTSDGSHRVLLPQQTYERACQLLGLIGMTDIRDLTDYDSLALPVWSVRQPKEAGPGRVIAYGKGVSSAQSQISAMMEAIEHYSAQQLPSKMRRATYSEMQQQERVLDLYHIASGTDTASFEDVVFEWLPGTDLVTGDEIWVPAPCVLLCSTLNGYLLPKSSSNGLAAGNVIEEAICHALCELIERDAWTLAWLRMVTIPYIRLVARRMMQHPQALNGHAVVSEVSLYPEIDVASMPGDVRQLIARFERVGVAVFVRDITSDIGIPTFLAVSRDAVNAGTSTIDYGTGSHPNSHVAILRAITECAQSRLAARDPELRTIQQGLSADMELCQQAIFSSAPNNMKRAFLSISTNDNRDILDDINYILRQLSCVGLQQVIAINVTLPKIGLPVVRVLIPGIEDWSVFNFSPQHCTLGSRGRKYLETPH